MSKISIIIPVYNAGKTIHKMIDSVINQTFKEIEIIIVNDGSTDNSLVVCESYATKDQRIKIINKSNEGVSIARNIGLEYAKCDYIMFVDADDWLEPNICELMYNEMIKEDSDLVICNHIIERNCGSERVSFNAHQKIHYENDVKYKIVLSLIEEDKNDSIHERASFRSPWGKLFKRKLILEKKLSFDKDLSIGEDFIFDLQYLMLCDKVIILEEYLYHYVKNSESALGKYKSNAMITYKELLLKLEKYLKDYFQEHEYLSRLNKLKIKYLLFCIDNEMRKENRKNILEKRRDIINLCSDEIYRIPSEYYKTHTLGGKSYIKLWFIKRRIYLPFYLYKKR